MVFCASSAGAAITAFSENLNSAGSLSEFKSSGANATGITFNAAAGTGGSGGGLVNSSGENVFYRPGTTPTESTSTFDFGSQGTGAVFSTTADFLWSNSTATDLTVINFGFTTNLTSNALSTTTGGSISGGIIRSSGSTSLQLRLRSNGATADSYTFAQSRLTAGSWYRVTLDLAKSATADQFGFVLSLFSIGADGTSSPVLAQNGSTDLIRSGNVTSSELYGSSAAYAVYDVRNTNGISEIDNLAASVVPEPSTVGLSVIALAGLALRRKRG